MIQINECKGTYLKGVKGNRNITNKQLTDFEKQYKVGRQTNIFVLCWKFAEITLVLTLLLEEL